jgi:hypothetical protein
VTLLVTGGSGYLGSELLRQQPDALATFHDTLDVNDADAVMRYFLKHGPDVASTPRTEWVMRRRTSAAHTTWHSLRTVPARGSST